MPEQITIVIADDHPLLGQGLVHVLHKRNNFKVVGIASDGSEALEMIRDNLPRIAILDVQMPRPDGFEVARIIINENLPTKIIFLTMFKEEEFVKKVMELGVKGYILKENAVIDVVKCVDAVVEGKFFISPQISDMLLNISTKTPAKESNHLTPTESKIVSLIGREKSSKEIAEELFISVKTVENHRSNICRKLGITGNSALLKYAIRNHSSE